MREIRVDNGRSSTNTGTHDAKAHQEAIELTFHFEAERRRALFCRVLEKQERRKDVKNRRPHESSIHGMNSFSDQT